MTTGATTLLGLALPVDGELDGTWGDVVNYGITDYVDIAVAGTLTLTGDGAVTLANTTGTASGTNIGATTAQYAIIRITGTLTTPKIITAPSYSKTYVVDNAATGSTVTFKASGQTGVSIAVGEKATVYYNGTDYVKVSTSTGTGSVTSVAGTGTVNGITLTGTVTSTGSLTLGGTLSGVNLTSQVTGTLPVLNGGTGTTTSTGTGNTVLSASPTFTGTPLAPTAATNTNTTQLATTAFVQNQIGAIAAGVSSFSAGTTGLTPSTASTGVVTLAGTLNVANGGTGTSTSTGSGSVVLATSPTLTTPVLGTPSSGTLSSCTVDGTNSVGYKTIPQNSESVDYTLVLADSGKYIYHPSTDANARTFTIPANSSVAYPIGTAISFVNMSTNALTIAITSDTMYLSTGATGSRTLAQYGSATALKMTSTTWLITGSNLT
jgi:hypothetical protein